MKKCRSPWEIKAEETGTGRIEFVVTNQQEHQNPKHMLRPVKNHLKALIEDQVIYTIVNTPLKFGFKLAPKVMNPKGDEIRSLLLRLTRLQNIIYINLFNKGSGHISISKPAIDHYQLETTKGTK